MTTPLHTQIRTMLAMQEAMNAKVNPDWRAEHYRWYRAIWIEAQEMISHINSWKWWKKPDPDMAQAKLELVDIWHFGLSDILTSSGLNNHDAIVEFAATALSKPHQPEPNLTCLLEDFVEVTLVHRGFDIDLFALILSSAGMTTDDLFRSYMGKSSLNWLRQQRGYQDGSYQKIWDGREDNEHMMELLAEADITSETFKDDFYQALADRYQSLTT